MIMSEGEMIMSFKIDSLLTGRRRTAPLDGLDKGTDDDIDDRAALRWWHVYKTLRRVNAEKGFGELGGVKARGMTMAVRKVGNMCG
jgi:hypothetical protein